MVGEPHSREDDLVTINRVRCPLTGAAGLPGVATFYTGSSVTDMSPIRTFWDAIKGNFPNTVTINIPASGDQINEATGLITGAWTGTVLTGVQGTGGVGAYLSTAGPMIRWSTSAVIDGRRPIGKTYLVPAMSSQFSSSGTILGSFVTSATAAAQALVVALAGELKLYHRKNAKGPGVAAQIIAGVCSTKQVVLRSRRD